MSTTYSIACCDCRKHIWIAQRNIGAGMRVYGSAEHLKGLAEFLEAHRGHALKFDDNCESDIGDMEEIEVDDPR